eukprot:SAG22_NODE_23_length_31399_cov_35.631313_3_plen_152_part_00
MADGAHLLLVPIAAQRFEVGGRGRSEAFQTSQCPAATNSLLILIILAWPAFACLGSMAAQFAWEGVGMKQWTLPELRSMLAGIGVSADVLGRFDAKVASAPPPGAHAAAGPVAPPRLGAEVENPAALGSGGLDQGSLLRAVEASDGHDGNV